MQGAMIRQQQPVTGRSKPVPRGASRLVADEPVSARLPRPSLGGLKRLLWPVLLVAAGFGAYEGAIRLMPYADRPITKIDVQGDLSYISQQSVQQRIAPYVAASFFSVDLPAMRAELEQMPWIAHAEVRRVWPDEVVIRLEEQLPVARWGTQPCSTTRVRLSPRASWPTMSTCRSWPGRSVLSNKSCSSIRY